MVHVVDAIDMTPLHHAAHADNAEAISLLLAAGAKVLAYDKTRHSALAVAAMSNATHAASALLRLDDVQVNERDVRRRTPLHWAASSGMPGVVADLLERGADISAVDSQGASPLHDAVHGGDAETVRVLLDGGADIFMDDGQGAMPLHVAAMAGSADACRVLVARLSREDAHLPFRLRSKGKKDRCDNCLLCKLEKRMRL